MVRRAVEEGGIERRGLALRAEQGARPRRLGDPGVRSKLVAQGSTEPARVTPIELCEPAGPGDGISYSPFSAC